MPETLVGMTEKSSTIFQCKYCNREFKRESTLIAHACERKRRFQQQHEVPVQWAMQAYLQFYSTTQTARTRTYEDFVDSPYYTAFVRFGRHCHSIHCINFANFTRWLLKNNHKLDHWCQERYYAEWMFDYIRRESLQDALERSIQTIADYVHDHPELRNGCADYFRLANENRICYHIATGRLSPWAVYQSESGQEFLGRLNDDQVATVIAAIDPEFWQAKFKDSPEDAAFARQVLQAAGL